MTDNHSDHSHHNAAPEGEPRLDEQTQEELDAFNEEVRAGAKEFSDAAWKLAQETGYAVAGFAGLVGDKAKAFYDEQKKEYAQTHPEAEKDPGAKEFLQQLSDKLNKFVEDLTRGYKDMAERGRETFDKRDDASANPADSSDSGGQSAADKPSMVVTDADLHEEPASDHVDVVEDDRDL